MSDRLLAPVATSRTGEEALTALNAARTELNAALANAREDNGSLPRRRRRPIQRRPAQRSKWSKVLTGVARNLTFNNVVLSVFSLWALAVLLTYTYRGLAHTYLHFFPPPPVHVPTPDFASCMVNQGTGQYITPQGVRAPLAGMAYGFASYTAGDTWLLDLPLPSIKLPAEIDGHLHYEDQWKAWHHAIDGKDGFSQWYKRMTAPSAKVWHLVRDVEEALAIDEWSFSKRALVRFTCWWNSNHHDCLPSSRRRDPSVALKLFLDMVRLIHSSCWSPDHPDFLDPSSAALPGPQLSHIRTAAITIQHKIQHLVSDIASHEIHHIRAITRASKIFDLSCLHLPHHLSRPPPRYTAPWAAADASRTRTMRTHHLMQPWKIPITDAKDIQIPTPQTQYRLNLLTAVWAYASWWEMVAFSLDAIEREVREECKKVVAQTEHIRDGLRKEDEEDEALGHLQRTLHLIFDPVTNETSSLLFHPSLPSFSLPSPSPFSLPSSSQSGGSQGPRTPFAKFWRHALIPKLKAWGDERRVPEFVLKEIGSERKVSAAEGIHWCLFGNISNHNNYDAAGSMHTAMKSGESTISAAIEASVYSFFLLGATTDWNTNYRPTLSEWRKAGEQGEKRRGSHHVGKIVGPEREGTKGGDKRCSAVAAGKGGRRGGECEDDDGLTTTWGRFHRISRLGVSRGGRLDEEGILKKVLEEREGLGFEKRGKVDLDSTFGWGQNNV